MQLLPDDDYPKKICFQCSSEVTVAFNLKRKVIESDQFAESHPEIKVEQNNEPIHDFLEDILVPEEVIDDFKLEQNLEEDEDQINLFQENCWLSNQKGSEEDDDLLVEIENKTKSSGRSTCYICFETFPDGKSRLNHLINDHPQDNKCATCGLEFTKATNYERHLMTHYISLTLAKQPVLAAEMNTCYICHTLFSSHDLRNKHLREDHEQENKCEACSMKFTSAGKYELHMRMHYMTAKEFTLRKSKTTKNEMTRMKLRATKRTISRKKGIINKHIKNSNTCYICNSTFSCRSYKYKHLRIDHPQDNECTICSVTFTIASNYERHLKRHFLQKEKKPFDVTGNSLMIDKKLRKKFTKVTGEKNTCYICHTKFTNIQIRYKHLLKDHQQDNECEPCSIKFTKASVYERHLMRHYFGVQKKEGELKCDLCPSVLKTRQSIEYHMNSLHLGIRDFVCKICGAQFTTMMVLKKHTILRHGGPETEKQFRCDKCDASYELEKSFLAHVAKCTKEKTVIDEEFGLTTESFKCDVCQRDFSSMFAYQKHMKYHLNGKNYLCSFCDETFHDYKTGLAHVTNHNENDPPKKFLLFYRRCYVCNLTVLSKSEHRKHIKTDHAEYVGRKCPKWPECTRSHLRGPFSYEMHLKNHAIGHSDVCPHCGIPCNSLEDLRSHIKQMHEFAIATCDYCGKTFKKGSIRIHVQKHIGAQPKHVCLICPNVSYNHNRSLENHNFRYHGTPARFVCKHCGEKYFYLNIWKLHEVKCAASSLTILKGDGSGRRKLGPSHKKGQGIGARRLLMEHGLLKDC